MTKYVVAALIAALAVALLSTFGYRRLYRETASSYARLQAQVKATNEEAARRLKDMTAQRDAMEKKWKTAAEAQEKTDAKAINQIVVDSAADRARPVGVLVARPAGGCRQHRPAEAPAAAGPRDEPADVPGGVLAPAAQQLVIGDRDAVERLQAAFNSCVRTLTGETE